MDVHGSRTAWFLAAALAAMACQAPMAVAAHVSPSRPVTPDGFYVERASLALAPSGSRSALLVAGHRRHPPATRLVARLGRGAALGASRTLDARASGFGGARVAVGPDGTAVAAWQANVLAGSRVDQHIVAAVARPGHGFGAPQTLASTSSTVSFGDVVVGRGGRAVVSWSSQARGGTIARVAFRRPTGSFGARQTLGAGVAPQLAVSPSGTVVAVWSTFAGAGAGAARVPAAAHATMPAGAARFAGATMLPAAAGDSWIDASSGPGGAVISRVVQLGAAPTSPYELRGARVGPTGPGPESAFGVAAGRTIGEPAFGLPGGGGLAAVFWSQDAASSALELLAGGAGGTLATLAPSISTAPAAGSLSDLALAAWGEKTGPGAARVRLSERAGATWRTTTVASGRAIRDIAIAAGTGRALLAWVQRDRSYPGRLRLAEARS